MARHSKRYETVAAQVDRTRKYEVGEAVALVKATATAGFDESVEVTLKLGIDPKRSDQMVRGSVSLPAGTGKKTRVIAFALGEAAEKAKAAGAIEAGGDELVKKISDGWMDFDVAVAHPEMMSKVGRLGRTLGPRGLMPSPKAGTVTEKVEQAVKEYIGGRVEYRADETGCVHVLVGKVSFSPEALAENVEAFIEHITAVKPVVVKGAYIRRGFVASTMGPGVELDLGGAG
ncbi:MAG: 50S ribosomal protein L1 [Planctomycetes bacterium]|nr:50S ribosomal protein L1 [Planctomycetota bacterium]